MGLFSSLVAGALSGGLGLFQDEVNRRHAGDTEARNLHWSRRAIQDRVRDAERAGIHPLYALGASTSTPMAQHVDGSGIASMGQNINEAVQRQMDRPTRDRIRLEEQLLALQMAKTSAETDEIRQRMALDLNRTTQGGGIPTTGLGLRLDPGQDKPMAGQDSGIYELVPPERKTSPPGMPGVESGLIPGFAQYTLPGGLNALLPASEEGISEVFENVPFWLWPSIWKINKDHYGEEHMNQIFKKINPLSGTLRFGNKYKKKEQWKRRFPGYDYSPK